MAYQNDINLTAGINEKNLFTQIFCSNLELVPFCLYCVRNQLALWCLFAHELPAKRLIIFVLCNRHNKNLKKKSSTHIAQNIAETCQKYFQSFIAIEILPQYFCQLFQNISLQHYTILTF